MNGIGWAVKQLQNGNKVQRAGWNGKGMFLLLIPGSTFTIDAERPMGKALPSRVGQQVNYLPHVDMYTAQGDFVPWLCSQTDLLALDWELVVVR